MFCKKCRMFSLAFHILFRKISRKWVYEAKFRKKNSQNYFRENFPFRDFFRNFRIFSRNRLKRNFANKVAFFASERNAKIAKIFAKRLFHFPANPICSSLAPPPCLLSFWYAFFMYCDPTHKLLDFLRDFILNIFRWFKPAETGSICKQEKTGFTGINFLKDL